MRKIIQIAGTETVVALCNDGAVFALVASEWREMPSIPQDHERERLVCLVGWPAALEEYYTFKQTA